MDDKSHIQLWEKCREIIRDNLPVEQYDAWFKDIVSLSYTDNALTLQVPTAFYAEQLDQKYIRLLAPVLRRVYGPNVKLYYNYLQVQSAPDTAVTQRSDSPSGTIIDHQAKAAPANPFTAAPMADIDPQLNPRYTFENYCGGESNKIVRSIAEAVANDPKNHTFNPFFIYGDVGVGKTHLMQAIGIRIKELNPAKRVLYVTARLFQAQYQAAVAHKNTNSFFHFYQSIDALLIDDVQDLAKLPGTQNIFYHIFNHLHQNNKTIIMSCDQAPVDMEGFEERLLSRFKWGISAELGRPDLALRKSVLTLKAERDGLQLPDSVRDFIAANVTSSIRDLEGIMVSLIAHATVLDCPLTIDLARTVVGKTVKVDAKPINFESLAKEVTTYYNLEPDALYTSSRKREISDARQILMYMARNIAKLSLVDIGRMLSRTHATVNYACNAIADRLTNDLQLQTDIHNIEAAVMAR